MLQFKSMRGEMHYGEITNGQDACDFMKRHALISSLQSLPTFDCTRVSKVTMIQEYDGYYLSAV